jgi:AraC-like DNA-binding protein
VERSEKDSELLAQGVATAPFVIESPNEGEQRLSFRVGDSWCRTSTLELRSGIRLGVTACQFEPSFTFSAAQPSSELEFVVSKGAVLRARTADGHDLQLGGSALHLGRTRSPMALRVSPAEDAPMECVSLSMGASRLRELLGVRELPEAFREVTESAEPHPLVSRTMTPGLFRLLEEISNADVKGASRLLWHEAKSLELIALMTDALVEAAEAKRPCLSANEIDRLERVRKCLTERLEEPPTLAELAHASGFNETKLKGGFRTRFGTSIFAYLRACRMEEARRLLLERRLSVSEIALRVGYSNPSKFAAAFRRHFGMSPSEL